MAQDFFQINSFDHNFRHASRLVQSNEFTVYANQTDMHYSELK